MKFTRNTALLVFIVLLVHSLALSVSAIDTGKVGVKKGDTFVYDFTDTIPKDQQDLDPQLLYVRDSNNNKVYLSDGQKLTITIDTPPSSSQEVIFKFETVDGSVRIKDHSDNYGQILLFNDWDYWRAEITPDTKVFASSENVTIVDNSTNFGSSHTFGFNVSSESSFTVHASFIYDKSTGMLDDLSYDLFFDYGNSSEMYNYGINLVTYTPSSGSSTTTIFIVIAIIAVVGFLIYRRNKGKNRSSPQMNQQYRGYQSTQQNQGYQGYQQSQPSQSTGYSTPGEPQVNPNLAKFCTNCGGALIPTNKFCTECGSKI